MPEKRKHIELQVFKTESAITYKGRLLGLLSPKEYAALFEKIEIRDKISTVATTELAEIGKSEKIDDLRMVMVVKERDGIPTNNRVLFVTEPLEHVSSYKTGEVAIVGSNNTYFVATEVDV